MMMKIILCAYTQSVFSGRKMETLLQDSVRMMWLAQGHKPSYRTINRFRVHPEVQALLRECFVQFRCHLVKEKYIDDEETDSFTCPNGQQLTFRYLSHKTDHYGFAREFKVYECESCSGCPLRSECTKAKEGNR